MVSRVSSAFLLICELFEDAAVKILFNMLWMLFPIESYYFVAKIRHRLNMNSLLKANKSNPEQFSIKKCNILTAKSGTNCWNASRLFVCTFMFESLLNRTKTSRNLTKLLWLMISLGALIAAFSRSPIHPIRVYQSAEVRNKSPRNIKKLKTRFREKRVYSLRKSITIPSPT